MTDKDKYLISRLDLMKLKRMIKRIQELKEANDAMIYSLTVGGIDYSKDRVQTSPANMMETLMAMMVDNTSEIKRIEAEVNSIKDSIYRLENAKYTKVLLEVFVENKSFRTIAAEGKYKYRSNVEYIYKRALIAYYDLYHNI